MEIERKFLTKEIPFSLEAYPKKEISQCYISTEPTIRIRQSGQDYILTVKGSGEIAKEEFELPISQEAYKRLLQKAETPAVEKIIEANTLLSGIGFESAGLAGAHAIHNGLTVLEECHHMYHGEKVAFGTIAQLVLEDVSAEELEDIISFCIEVGLPVTLGELGVKEITKEKIMAVAEAACAENDTLHNMPFEVTPEKVYAAIMAADAYGHYFLGE